MADGIRRTVLLASVAYIDAGGRVRRGNQGDVIEVDADNVERFDRLNGTPQFEKNAEDAPKRPRRRTQKSEE